MAIPSVSSITSSTTTAASLANLVLVTPSFRSGYQPYLVPGPLEQLTNTPLPLAFLFNYDGEQTVTCESDITDHYVESNSGVQDMISLKPVKVTTQGYIGELTDIVPEFLSKSFAAAQALQAIPIYGPKLSLTAITLYQKALLLAETATSYANSAIAAWTSVTGKSNGVIGNATVINGTEVFTSTGVQNKQQIAFQQFYAWWSSRIFFNVLTPWALFEDMAIASLKPIQAEDSRVVTSFEITFKQIRTTNSAIKATAAQVASGRLISQASPTQSQGFSSPRSSISLSAGLVQIN